MISLNSKLISSDVKGLKCELCDEIPITIYQDADGIRQCARCKGDKKCFVDKHATREVGETRCQCPNSVAGCDWTGKIGAVQQHVLECEYIEVCCQYACGANISMKDSESHKAICELRPDKCQNCAIEGTHKYVLEHLCPEDIIKCKCGFSIKQANIEVHKTDHCPVSILSCEFSSAGCIFRGNREERKSHYISSASEHIRMVYRQISTLVLPFMEDLRYLKAFVTTLDSKVVNIREAAANSQQSSRENRSAMDRLSQKAINLEKESSSNKETMELIQSSLTEVLLRLELCEEGKASVDSKGSETDLLSVRLSEISNSILTDPGVSTDGSTVWDVPDFREKMIRSRGGANTSIYSPPFYTSRHGYKLCIRLYPNGDGVGRDTHVSIFVAVMKHAYDDILKWPFQRKVTLMILDPKGRDHIIDSFRPDPKSSSFEKPKGSMNIASGCPRFVTQADAINRTSASGTLFVKIIIND